MDPSLDHLYRALPELPELVPLREAILGASVPDPDKQWSNAGKYSTCDKRILPAEALDGVIHTARSAAVARIERVYDAAAAILGAAAAADDALAVHALLELGEAAERAQDWQQASASFSVAAGLAAALPDRAPLSLALRRLGRVRLAAGALDEALRLYRASLEQATAIGDDPARATALTGMGNALSFQGMWAESRSCYEQALELCQADDPRVRAQLHVNLAMVAREEEQFDAARAWLAAARTAWSIMDELDRSSWHNSAGLLELSLGALDQAERELTDALALAPGAYETAVILDNLTEVAIRRGQLTVAETCARRAEQHALAASSPVALAEIYIRLGRIFRLLADANGVTFFEKALELCRAHGYATLEAATYTEYAAFRETLGDSDEARAYAARADEIRAARAPARPPAR